MEATKDLVYDISGSVIQSDLDPKFSKRFSELSHMAQTWVSNGAATKESFSLAKSQMSENISKLDSLPKPNLSNRDGIPKDNAREKVGSKLKVVYDPIRKKRLGPANSRLKSSLETKSKKSRSGRGISKEPQNNDLNLSQAVNMNPISVQGFVDLLQRNLIPSDISVTPRHAPFNVGLHHPFGLTDTVPIPYDHSFMPSQETVGSTAGSQIHPRHNVVASSKNTTYNNNP